MQGVEEKDSGGWGGSGVAGAYRMGPFVLVSELPLVELQEGDGPGRRRVEVRLGAVSAEGLRKLPWGRSVAPGRFLLEIEGVARYLAEDGRRVTVEVAAGAPAADVRGYLLGSVFGALCHQNGMLPLHASAVERGGRVVAFLGESGAGKSTTAAFLERRGYRVVADDICLVDGLDAEPFVTPVAGWLKLWRQSFEALAERPEEGTQVFSATDKFRRYLPATDGDGLRLRHAVLLERGEELGLERVGAARAVASLMELTYLDYLPAALGEEEAQFRRVSAALRGVEVWRLRVPAGWGLAGAGAGPGGEAVGGGVPPIAVRL